MARQKVPPLDWQTPIVNPESGTPSPQFARLWQSMFQNSDENYVATGDAAADAAAALEGLNDKADKSINLVAGSGLGGGGDLSADRSFDVGAGTGISVSASSVSIADTAVTPGTYGDSTHVGQFTVDQQGRITAASNVVVSGGGGGGAPWWFDPPMAADFTAVSGDGTTPTFSDDADVGLILNPGAQVSGNIGRTALTTIPSPTADWSCEIALDMWSPLVSFCLQGVYLRNTTTTKSYVMGRIAHANDFLVVQRLASISGTPSDLFADDFLNASRLHYFKITYTAATTTYAFFVSADGKNFQQLATAGMTDHFGTGNQADQIGFGVCYNYTSPSMRAYMTVPRFVHSW